MIHQILTINSTITLEKLISFKLTACAFKVRKNNFTSVNMITFAFKVLIIKKLKINHMTECQSANEICKYQLYQFTPLASILNLF